ncbi:hypothetical protein [Empedobacter sedimenti]|uniref:hypothetical protein n=1 Tax=Empedobacter sedimenti TaxID=3042610 RepID=UPI0024A683EA|nr:hypothetical protein [Empedobacter sedimenti]
MRKILFIFLLSTSLFAQEKATNLLNVGLDVIGFGVQYEKAINDNVTTVGSVEYMANFYSVDHPLEFDLKTIYTLKLSLEGRYYYNFEQRMASGKTTTNNSANYFGLRGSIFPDWLTTTNEDGAVLEKRGIISFNYGFKRSFNKYLFYEAYGGIGILFTKREESQQLYLDENNKYQERTYRQGSSDGSFDIGFRIGYNF